MTKMLGKRSLFSLLCGIVCALSLFMTPMALAEDAIEIVALADNAPTLDMPNKTALPGETVSLAVSLSNNPGIIGATLEVDFDGALSLTGISNGDAFARLDMTRPGKLVPGCRIHWDAVEIADADVKDGTVVTLAFVVPETAADGDSYFVRVSSATSGDRQDVYDRNLDMVDLQPAECVITVGADKVHVTGIEIDCNSVLLNGVGATEQLVATVLPDDAADKSVVWSSRDESVARVSADGLVTAAGEGRTVVEATTSDGGFVATCEVTVVVHDIAATITTSPVEEDAYAVFDCEVGGADASMCSYRWQYSTNGGASWRDSSAASAASPSFRVKATRARIDGWQFRCVVGYGGTEVFSDAAMIEEARPASILSIIAEPADVMGARGTTGSATVVAEGDGLTYQWYFRPAGGTKWTASGFATAKEATLQVPINNTNLARVYKCVVSDVYGQTAETREVGVIECATLAITSEPADVVGAKGSTGSATVVATGDGLTYQWYFRPVDGTKWTASGFATAKEATLQVPVNNTNLARVYRCTVADAHGNTAETREVSVRELGPLSAAATTIQVAINEYATFACEVGGTEGAQIAYQWELSRDGGASWSASSGSGAQTASLRSRATDRSVGYLYRCRVTASDGREAVTEPVGFSVLSLLAITSEPADVVGAKGSTGSATVVAEGDGLTYQWYFRPVDGTKWSASGFATGKSATIEIPINSTNLARVYRCTVTDAHGNTAETREVSVRELGPLSAAATTIQVAINEYATFACEVGGTEGAQIAYQWELSRDGGASWSASSGSGAQTASLRSRATDRSVGYLYRCRVTASDGREAVTEPVGFSVRTSLSIVSEPADVSGTKGSTGSATVVATGDGLTYQWYFRALDGTKWTASGFATGKSATIEIPINATNLARVYRCTVADAYGNTVETREVSVTQTE